MGKVFLIDGSNFMDFPKGGQLSFCSQLLEVFPEGYFKLVGITTDKSQKPGSWHPLIIEGKKYDFFPAYFLPEGQIKGWLPERLKFFVNLLRYHKSIFGQEVNQRIFTNTPEALIAINLAGKNSRVIHFLHGVENPLIMPRFKWGKLIKTPFWKLFLRALSKAELLAATADVSSIKKLKESNGIRSEIIPFPTRFDDKVFQNLHFTKPALPLFVYCGRINKVKGWGLLIDSFHEYLKKHGEAELVFLGDGEDRAKLEQKVLGYGLTTVVTITGFINKLEIAYWLNKASVFVLPSYKEGWPIALLEALACGLPVVATNVSGVHDMIQNGVNGFIVFSREPEEFAQAMFLAAKLDSPNQKSLNIAKGFKASGLKAALIESFPQFFDDL
jgi:glycosyltransferase involved in cell wall biosynthesis